MSFYNELFGFGTCQCHECSRNASYAYGAQQAMAAQLNNRDVLWLHGGARGRGNNSHLPRARIVAGKLWQLTWKTKQGNDRKVTAMSLEQCWYSYNIWRLIGDNHLRSTE